MESDKIPSGVTLSNEQTFRLPSKKVVLTIHRHRKMSGQFFTASYPSRELDPVTPELLRDYARAWLDAADWLEEQQTGKMPQGYRSKIMGVEIINRGDT